MENKAFFNVHFRSDFEAGVYLWDPSCWEHEVASGNNWFSFGNGNLWFLRLFSFSYAMNISQSSQFLKLIILLISFTSYCLISLNIQKPQLSELSKAPLDNCFVFCSPRLHWNNCFVFCARIIKPTNTISTYNLSCFLVYFVGAFLKPKQ